MSPCGSAEIRRSTTQTGGDEPVFRSSYHNLCQGHLMSRILSDLFLTVTRPLCHFLNRALRRVATCHEFAALTTPLCLEGSLAHPTDRTRPAGIIRIIRPRLSYLHLSVACCHHPPVARAVICLSPTVSICLSPAVDICLSPELSVSACRCHHSASRLLSVSLCRPLSAASWEALFSVTQLAQYDSVP